VGEALPACGATDVATFTQRHGGAGGTASIGYVPTRATYPTGTVVHFNDTFRALFLNLEDWVARGTLPPVSQVPKVADGTLVRQEALVFPAMKGLTWAVGGVQTMIPDFSYRGLYNNFPLFDFGPLYIPQDESGIATILPPRNLGRDYAIMVPQVDASTGLTRAGIRSVEARAPLGTSIEFNYVATPGITDLANLTGSFIPFHKTRAPRHRGVRAAAGTRPWACPAAACAPAARLGQKPLCQCGVEPA